MTRLLDFYVIFGHLQHRKIAQKHIKFAKVRSKCFQIPSKLFQNGQSCLTLCQSGKILPNLVTLPFVHRSNVEDAIGRSMTHDMPRPEHFSTLFSSFLKFFKYLSFSLLLARSLSPPLSLSLLTNAKSQSVSLQTQKQT